MLYTPRFCCHCGEKVEREKWGLFSSRRFCENCEIDFPLQKWIPALWLGAGAIIFLFGFGGYLKKAETTRQAETPGIVKNVEERNADAPKSVAGNMNAVGQTRTNINAASVEPTAKPATLAELNRASPESPGGRQNPEVEEGFYCGAQTKKGTPCTRRVKKGGGRCWQHRGQLAMPIADSPFAGQ